MDTLSKDAKELLRKNPEGLKIAMEQLSNGAPSATLKIDDKTVTIERVKPNP